MEGGNQSATMFDQGSNHAMGLSLLLELQKYDEEEWETAMLFKILKTFHHRI